MDPTKQFSFLKNMFLPAALVVLSGLFFSACGSSSNAEKIESQDTQDKNEIAEAPTFDVNSYTGPNFSLASAEGPVVKFTDLLGKGPVVLNFWGTWCGPCRYEMPELKRIWAEYESKGVLLVGVALRDTPLRVTNYTTQQGITWMQLIGTYQTTIDYGNIVGVPTTIIYSSQGVELSRYVGPMSYDMLRNRLDNSLANEADQAS